LLYGAGLVSF